MHPTLQKRLSELVEALDAQLDPTVTSDLSQAGLCRMVWLLTKQKPQVCLSRLRCEDYGELNTRLHQRHLVIAQSCAEVQAALQSIKTEVILTDGFIGALAEAQGWSDEWLVVQEPKNRGRGPKAVAADAQRDAMQSQRIPEMMKAASQAAQGAHAGPAAPLPSSGSVQVGGQVRPPPPRSGDQGVVSAGRLQAPAAVQMSAPAVNVPRPVAAPKVAIRPPVASANPVALSLVHLPAPPQPAAAVSVSWLGCGH